MQYTKEKFTKEINELEFFFNILKKDWKTSKEDYENLFRIRIHLYVVAAIARLYSPKKFNLEAIRDIKSNEEPTLLIYTSEQLGKLDNEVFRNKVSTTVSLKEICDYLIHQQGSHFTDNRFENSLNFNIFYSVYTDKKPEIMFSLKLFIDRMKSLV